MRGDLRVIVKARRPSQTYHAQHPAIYSSLFSTIMILGVPLAAGALYPTFGILLPPMIASIAITFSSVSVIANALRLNKVKL